jgi:hypothetical protein
MFERRLDMLLDPLETSIIWIEPSFFLLVGHIVDEPPLPGQLYM